MLRLEDVSYRYDRGPPVLREVTVSVEAGLTALMGPNGSGKSTLLKVAAGLAAPWRGVVYLDGRPLARYSRWERARRTAYLPQQALLPDGMSVMQVVLLGRVPHTGWFGAETARDRAAAWQAMEATGIVDLAGRPVDTLSGGERQRVALARALATGARHLLLDEPTSHLDLQQQGLLLATLHRLVRRDGLAALMVVHDPNLAALADRVVLLAGGRVVAEGPPREVLTPDSLARAFEGGFDVLEAADGRRAVLPAPTGARA